MMGTPESCRDYERWLNGLSLNDVRRLFRDHGATHLFCKELGANNNSKQQIYVAGDVSEVGWIPSGEVGEAPSTSGKGTGRRGPIYRFPIKLSWILPSGVLEPVRAAKLIAYPQYPEVRLSGFLAGAANAPSFLMNETQRGHDPGRLLFLAPRDDGMLLALCVPPESAAAREFSALENPNRQGVFVRLRLDAVPDRSDLDELMERLCRIHQAGWLPSRRLGRDGRMSRCMGPNCGGYTLEAMLGIQANSLAEPDFGKWELKTRNVRRLESPESTRVTLMTPEPNGGIYADGVEAFVRRWGYLDNAGRPDRLNFGGIYRCGDDFHHGTGLKLVLDGYEADTGKFTGEGTVMLVDRSGTEAASWSFAKLLEHWKRKHAHTAYVLCQKRTEPELQYRYGNEVTLAEGTGFRDFLDAFSKGAVYYDPGIKIEKASTGRPELKRRSQIRIKSGDLPMLYSSFRVEPACRN